MIGGPNGHSDIVKKTTNHLISFSKMTFPQAKWYQIGSISCQTLFVVDKNTTEAIFGVFCNEIIDFERSNFRVRANLNRF